LIPAHVLLVTVFLSASIVAYCRPHSRTRAGCGVEGSGAYLYLGTSGWAARTVAAAADAVPVGVAELLHPLDPWGLRMEAAACMTAGGNLDAVVVRHLHTPVGEDRVCAADKADQGLTGPGDTTGCAGPRPGPDEAAADQARRAADRWPAPAAFARPARLSRYSPRQLAPPEG
jgi:hypothetical protein